jgi:ribosomal subunit interface protein
MSFLPTEPNRLRCLKRQHRGRSRTHTSHLRRRASDQPEETDMNDVPLHIMSHGIELSSPLRKFLEKKISALRRFAGDILSAQVVLREKSGAKGLFSVKARLALPGRDIHGNAVHENFYAAINQLVARLARLSRKRKTRYEKHVRRARRFHDFAQVNVRCGLSSASALVGNGDRKTIDRRIIA